jgi:hypothetical protein
MQKRFFSLIRFGYLRADLFEGLGEWLRGSGLAKMGAGASLLWVFFLVMGLSLWLYFLDDGWVISGLQVC